MISLIENEIYKIVFRKKFYMFLAIILIFSLFIAVSTYIANKAFGSDFIQSTNGRLAESLIFNGQSFPLALLDSLTTFIIPIILIIIISEIITGEYAEGTLKLPLLRQITRGQLLFSKAIASILALAIILLFTLLIGYILGLIFFPWGNGILLKGAHLTPFKGILLTVTLYFASIFPIAAFSMIIIFLAVVFTNEGSVISLGVGILIGLGLITQIFYEFSPLFINSYFSLYDILCSEGSVVTLILAVPLSTIYLLLFYSLSFAVIKRKSFLI